MSVAEVFQRITSSLDQAAIRYMLTGSFASAYYGVARATQDIDFVVEATGEQLQAFSQLLPTEDFYIDLQPGLEAVAQQSMFNVIDKKGGWKIDLIIRKSRTFSVQEFERRKLAEVQGISLFIATAEDVVISKLEWATLGHSQRQLEDAAGIVRMRWESLDRDYLKKCIADLKLATAWSETLRMAGISSG